jgi:glycosyltransferase involved in cell wall biosynthesis
VQALRFHSRLYLHGHRVGGTNPSLVEALGAQCAVVAHDNPFNRWVAGPGAAYFGDEAGCARVLDTLLDNDEALARMRRASYARFRERFTWPLVLGDYEALLSRWHPPL